jgi:dynein heavy chain
LTTDYTKEVWRTDLRKLIRNAGSLRQDTVLYVHGSEMLRHEFLLNDVDSILASGEVPGIFSTDEKHELNEVREFHFFASLQHLKICHFYSICYV